MKEWSKWHVDEWLVVLRGVWLVVNQYNKKVMYDIWSSIKSMNVFANNMINVNFLLPTMAYEYLTKKYLILRVIH